MKYIRSNQKFNFKAGQHHIWMLNCWFFQMKTHTPFKYFTKMVLKHSNYTLRWIKQTKNIWPIQDITWDAPIWSFQIFAVKKLPGDEFNECRRKLDSGLGVKDWWSGVSQEVGGDDLLVGVAQNSLHRSLRHLLDLGADLVVAGVLYNKKKFNYAPIDRVSRVKIEAKCPI